MSFQELLKRYEWLLKDYHQLPTNIEELNTILMSLKIIYVEKDLDTEKLETLKAVLENNPNVEEIRYGANVDVQTINNVNEFMNEEVKTERIPVQVISIENMTEEDIKKINIEDKERTVLKTFEGETTTLDKYQNYIEQNEAFRKEVADVNLTNEEELIAMYGNVSLANDVGSLQTDPFNQKAMPTDVYQKVGGEMGFSNESMQKDATFDSETLENFHSELTTNEQMEVLHQTDDYTDLKNNINTVLDTRSEDEFFSISAAVVILEGSKNLVVNVEKSINDDSKEEVISQSLLYNDAANEKLLEPLTKDFASKCHVVSTDVQDSQLNTENKDIMLVGAKDIYTVFNIDANEASKLVTIANTVEPVIHEENNRDLSIESMQTKQYNEEKILAKRLEAPKGFMNTILVLTFILLLIVVFAIYM